MTYHSGEYTRHDTLSPLCFTWSLDRILSFVPCVYLSIIILYSNIPFLTVFSVSLFLKTIKISVPLIKVNLHSPLSKFFLRFKYVLLNLFYRSISFIVCNPVVTVHYVDIILVVLCSNFLVDLFRSNPFQSLWHNV